MLCAAKCQSPPNRLDLVRQPNRPMTAMFFSQMDGIIDKMNRFCICGLIRICIFNCICIRDDRHGPVRLCIEPDGAAFSTTFLNGNSYRRSERPIRHLTRTDSTTIWTMVVGQQSKKLFRTFRSQFHMTSPESIDLSVTWQFRLNRSDNSWQWFKIWSFLVWPYYHFVLKQSPDNFGIK